MAKKPKPVKLGDLAIGSYEAACVLGVHFTQPKRMADKGLLTARALKSPTDRDTGRVFAVYSLAECQRDYEDYEERLKSGEHTRRARTAVDERGAMIKKLAGEKQKIEFGDAIGAAEAGRILGVHFSFPVRMAQAGKIKGRCLHNSRPDTGGSALWIFSRASCEAEAAATKRIQEAGKKPGRPRRFA
jgi:hypothetical protein